MGESTATSGYGEPLSRNRYAWPSGRPFPHTGLVGRERELAEVARLTGAMRLVTLVTPER